MHSSYFFTILYNFFSIGLNLLMNIYLVLLIIKSYSPANSNITALYLDLNLVKESSRVPFIPPKLQ